MSDIVIETTALSKRYGSKWALRELSLALPRGGVHAVIGSNGAGKSTLFRVLLGLASATSGSCRALGCDSRELTPEVRGRIGLVNEEHTLPGWVRVGRLVEMQKALYASWDEKTYRQVVGHFHVLPEQKVSQLSRGERAGLNLALAMAQSPELLILDEPTLGLDVVAKQAFLQSLLFAGSEERTVVYCSHQMDEIERVADNLIILERGELVSQSAPEEFCERFSYWVADWEAGAVDPWSLPGVLQSRDIDGQHHLVVLDRDDCFSECLQGMGATSVQSVPLGLDQAVNAYLTRNHIAPS